jgi:RHS repeat-associated protein
MGKGACSLRQAIMKLKLKMNRNLFVLGAILTVLLIQKAEAGSDRLITESTTNPTKGSQGSGDVDVQSGAYTYALPIELPVTRGRISPTVVLNYSSSNSNGWCGVGWDLGFPKIIRETANGVPVKRSGIAKYDDSYGFVVLLNGTKTRLIEDPKKAGTYWLEKGSPNVSFQFKNLSWTMKDGQGNTFLFGSDILSRLDNEDFYVVKNGVKVASTDGTSTYEWALDKATDPNGNFYDIDYLKDEGILYPQIIKLNCNPDFPNGTATVRFTIGKKDPESSISFDSKISYLTGFETRLDQRLLSVKVDAGNSETRTYTLTYKTSNNSGRALLKKVSISGSCPGETGIVTTSAPTISFSYNEPAPSFLKARDWTVAGGSAVMMYPSFFEQGGAWSRFFLDMDGDGIKDYVSDSIKSEKVDVFFNNGKSGFHAPIQWGGATTFHARSSGANEAYADNYFGFDSSSYRDYVDVDGDGLADRIGFSPDLTPFFSKNAGRGFSANDSVNNLSSAGGTRRVSSYQKEGSGGDSTFSVELADLNGDGCADYISKDKTTDAFWNVRFSNKTSFSSPVKWPGVAPINQNAVLQYHNYGIEIMDYTQGMTGVLVDMNGDGLLDRVDNAAPSRVYVYFNNGHGFSTKAYKWVKDDKAYPYRIAYGDSKTYYGLVDVNGDGLPDMVVRDAAVQAGTYALLNTGTSFSKPVNIHLEGLPLASIDTVGITFGFVDMDGDGITDYVAAKSTGKLSVSINQSAHADKLLAVNNGMGAKTTVAYIRSSQINNRQQLDSSNLWSKTNRSLLPLTLSVVSKMTVSDGFNNSSTKTYSYSGGYYSPERREFKGFRSVAVKDAYGCKTITYFHQDGGQNDPDGGEYSDGNSISKAGMPYRIENYDKTAATEPDGKPFQTTFNMVREVPANNAVGTRFSYVERTLERRTAFTRNAKGEVVKASSKDRGTSYAYSKTTGNLTDVYDYGRVSGFAASTYKWTDSTDGVYHQVITYKPAASFAGSAIVNRPSLISSKLDEVLVGEKKFDYDTRGNLTGSADRRDFIAESESSQTTWLGWTAEYDGYGLMTWQQENGTGIKTDFLYDSTKTFPIKATVNGFVADSSYNRFAGQPTELTDVTGVNTKWFYDGLGRLTEVRRAGVSVLQQSYSLLAPDSTGKLRAYLQVKTADGKGGWVIARQYMDPQGRPIQTRAQSENGLYRVTDTYYNTAGMTVSETRPYFSSSDPAYTDRVTSNRTLYAYDVQGRLTTVTPPAGDLASPTGASTNSYDIDGDPWKTGAMGPKGHLKITTCDGHGRVATVVEKLGATILATLKYGYAAQSPGQTVTVTDAMNKVTTIRIDTAGFKTSIADPTTGLSKTFYDNAGRLSKTVDALGSSIVYGYEPGGLGRLESKTVHGKSVNDVGTGALVDLPDATVTYGYYPSSSATGTKGQLSSMTDAYGSEGYAYDTLGRLATVTRSLTLDGVTNTYATGMQYDSVDRVAGITYPQNGGQLNYTYDAVGHVQSAKLVSGTAVANLNVYSQPVFNATGQRTAYTYGNGVATTIGIFQKSLRVSNVTAVSAGSGTSARTLQNLNFTYDSLGNIATVDDKVRATGNDSQSLKLIKYDSFNRLQKATYASGKSENYTYNTGGNILTTGSGSNLVSYSYDSTRPNLVTGAYGKTYRYDANGNMIRRGVQEVQKLAYDGESRLTSVKEGNQTVTFGYDGNGQRLWKYDGTSRHIWIGGIYEIVPGITTAQVMGNSQPVASFGVLQPEGKTLCHVYVEGERIMSYEPVSGGSASLYPNTPFFQQLADLGSNLQQMADWPLDSGRAPFTFMMVGLMLFLGISIPAHLRASLSSCTGLAQAPPNRFLAGWRMFRRCVSSLWEWATCFQPGTGSLGRQVVVVSLIASLFGTFASETYGQSGPTVTPLVYYYHNDQLGGAVVITDSGGVEVQRYTYTPFGQQRYKGSESAFPISSRFTGQVLDEDTGLYYCNSRYYDSELGRFTQPDSIVPDPSSSQSFNRFSYVRNNPLNMVDPSGHSEEYAYSFNQGSGGYVEQQVWQGSDGSRWGQQTAYNAATGSWSQQSGWIGGDMGSAFSGGKLQVKTSESGGMSFSAPAVQQAASSNGSGFMNQAAEFSIGFAEGAAVGLVAGVAVGVVATALAGTVLAPVFLVGVAAVGGYMLGAQLYKMATEGVSAREAGQLLGGIVVGGVAGRAGSRLGSRLFAVKEVGRGYQSFSAFKRAEGVAGKGRAWHHVVEQTSSNVERFGPEAIHNTENLVNLPHGPGTIHNQISGFYSSKQPFTGGLTVRQWLSTQSFEEQSVFGRNVIQQFGGEP